ncbi:MAG: hypothetical protein FJ272_05080, partial [Planctomycetes bacterium]|nr:hypothetical protein [Planctomycetota bacterium]
MLKAGFAVADITPELGKHIPGGYAPRISTGVLDPLQARACVAAGERETAAVVGVDAVSVRADIVAEARTRIRAACGIPERNVLIAASHTHSGGPSNDVLGVDCDPAYAKQLAAGIAEAVVTAHSRLQPAEVACGSGRCEGLSFNRRFKMRGGGEATNPKKGSPDLIEPAGPVDPELGVIAFRGKNGRLLGVIGNFGCHCTVIGGEKFSGDYPAYWQQALGLDIPLVFLNGACGDISQRDHRNAQVMEMGVEWAKRMGRALATETRRVLERAEFTENADVATAHGATWVRYRRAEPAVLEEHRRVLASDVPFKAKWLARDVVLLHEQI